MLNSSKTKLITFTGSVAVVRRAVAGPRVAGTKNIGSDDICGGARRLLRIEVADVVKTFIEMHVLHEGVLQREYMKTKKLCIVFEKRTLKMF